MTVKDIPKNIKFILDRQALGNASHTKTISDPRGENLQSQIHGAARRRFRDQAE
jgi:hypothetical protein